MDRMNTEIKDLKEKYTNETFWSIGMADPFPDETTIQDNVKMLGD